MRNYIGALNYEFQRLNLVAIAEKGQRGHALIRARQGIVRVPAYPAMMILAEIPSGSVHHIRENALTQVLSL